MQEMLELARRYDVRAPRYTSYPTAADFTTDVGAADMASAIIASNNYPLPAPVALYIHLPFCRSLCYYCACNKVVTRNTHRTRRYLELVPAEAGLLAPLLAADRSVTQIHLGGGTPTYYGPDELETLIAALGRVFRLAPADQSDWSIEVDPRTVSPRDIEVLRTLGFTRLSFGVQDLDPSVQEAINRRLAPEALEELVSAARVAGFRSINFDLIYGLPRQTPESFVQTLSRVIELRPDRLAMYAYAHLPQRFRAQRLLDARGLPSGADRLALLLNAITTLTGAGYEYIGMDHFALPEDALARSRRAGTLVRNFQGYVPGPDTDLIGLGASAISSLGGAYVQNLHAVPDWEAAIADRRFAAARGYVLDDDDRIRRDVIAAIMCRDTVLFEEFENRYDISFAGYFDAALEHLAPLEDDGLLRRTDTQIEITPTGRLFLRAIAMLFDARLSTPREAATPVYSRVV